MRSRVVFFDLETTGTNVARDEIIQIAAIAVDSDLNEVETFEVKLVPSHEGMAKLATMKAEGFATVFDKAVWEAEAVPTRVGVFRFSEWLKRFPLIRQVSKNGHVFWLAQLVGHNAARFDGEFLFRVAKELGVFMPASYHVLDTLQLALWAKVLRGFNPPSYKLEELASHLEVPLEKAHDARDDIRATVGVAEKLIRLMS